MRELLIIRHAIAYERDTTRWPTDDDRPLTDAGIKKFRRVARHLSALVPVPDEVLSSPLKRATQTARVLRRRAGFPRARELPALRPNGSTEELIAALAGRKATCVAIVGHEPSLSRLVAALLGAQDPKLFRLKKGGVAWLSFDAKPRQGAATLRAWLPPRVVASKK